MFKTLQKLYRASYLPCPITNHQSSPLNLICADACCPNPNLLCIHCQQQSHLQHKTILLTDYLIKLMVSIRTQLQSQNVLTYAQRIEASKRQCIQFLKQIKIDVVQAVDQLVYQIQVQEKVHAERVMEVLGLGGRVEKFVDLYTRLANMYQNGVIRNQELSQRQQIQKIHSSIQKLMQKILEISKIEPDIGLSNLEEEPTVSLSPLHPQLNLISQTYERKLQRVKKTLRKPFTQLLACVPQTSQKLNEKIHSFILAKHNKFAWSTSLKTSAIAISGAVAQRKQGNSLERFALFQNSLQPFINNKRKIAWVLRVVKLSGWIGLGVCIKDKIVGVGYKFTYENLGHGSYLISSNGYTWSSSKLANNSAYVGSFNYTTNDYIVVQFQGQPTWKLNFYIIKQAALAQKVVEPTQTKQTNQYVQISRKSVKKFKDSTDQTPLLLNIGELQKNISLDLQKNHDYYPCVNLCSIGDSVEIIS